MGYLYLYLLLAVGISSLYPPNENQNRVHIPPPTFGLRFPPLGFFPSVGEIFLKVQIEK